MPALQIAQAVRDRHFRHPHEIDSDQCRDVGDRVIRPRDMGPILQLAVEKLKKLHYPRLVRLAPIRHLRGDHSAHRRMQMLEHARHWKQEMEFGPAIPHFNQRALQRANAE
jgi:hypothetical protein